jgi:hypothetical protein
MSPFFSSASLRNTSVPRSDFRFSSLELPTPLSTAFPSISAVRSLSTAFTHFDGGGRVSDPRVARLFSLPCQASSLDVSSICCLLPLSLQPLCSVLTPRFFYFQQLTASFCKTGGWHYPLRGKINATKPSTINEPVPRIRPMPSIASGDAVVASSPPIPRARAASSPLTGRRFTPVLPETEVVQPRDL